MPTNQEKFTFTFKGPALDNHTVPVTILAQSLVALDKIVKKTSEKCFSNNSSVDLKVDSGFRAGSFNVDLIADYIDITKEVVAPVVGCVDAIFETIKLFIFLNNNEIKAISSPNENNLVDVTNNNGDIQQFNHCTVNIFQSSQIPRNYDQLTRVLDNQGVDSISFTAGSNQTQISKDKRYIFKIEQGVVVNESESTLVLEVLNASLGGDSKGWRFYDGCSENLDGFPAIVEDEVFLQKVKDGEIQFRNGTQLSVNMRVVQKKSTRLTTERSIVEVLSVLTDIEEKSLTED